MQSVASECDIPYCIRDYSDELCAGNCRGALVRGFLLVIVAKFEVCSLFVNDGIICQLSGVGVAIFLHSFKSSRRRDEETVAFILFHEDARCEVYSTLRSRYLKEN